MLFLVLALFGAVAGLAAWAGSKLARRRRNRQEQEGAAPRPWGGRDRERVRSKYFEKERRIREQRLREKAQRQHARTAEPDVPPGPVDLERLHGETLGLENDRSPEAIKRAYKDRMREYHPDRVVDLGVKIRRLAEEETKRINEAYRYFRQRYGF